jgi:DNA-binding response OmpR family regulator
LVALHTEDALTRAGYNVVGLAYDLAEAKQLAATEDIDCAVLDVNLADEFVWPAAEILHRRGVNFMLLTGFGSTFELPARLLPRRAARVEASELDFAHF